MKLKKFGGIVLLLVIIIAITILFPKGYFTYQGLLLPAPGHVWKPEKCIGFSYEITHRIPDGPDRNCVGIVTR